MKSLVFFVWFASIVVACSADAGKAVALVVGNGAYDKNALQNPVNDATAMAASLQRIGYEVILETDRTRQSMKEAFRAFNDALEEGGVAVFYFAGHAVQIDGKNFLLPVDSDLTRPFEVESESLEIGLVLNAMRLAKTKINVVILDSCRDNPFVRGFRGSGSAGLVAQPGPPNTLIAFSTAPGSVALDGNGDHSPFTEALLTHIENADLTIPTLFQTVAKSVTEETGGKQRPWKSDDFGEDIYLVRKANLAEVDAPPIPTDGLVLEFSPAENDKKKFHHNFEITGLADTGNGVRIPLTIEIDQSLEYSVGDYNRLTGERTVQGTASDVSITITMEPNGQAQSTRWNSDGGRMPPLTKQYLTPAGVSLINTLVKSPYRFNVNQFGKIQGTGLGFEDVVEISAKQLGVSREELAAYAVQSGTAFRFGPSLTFMVGEVFPRQPVGISEKWLDAGGAELKLISRDGKIARIAATAALVPAAGVDSPEINSLSGFFDIEEVSGWVEKMSLRGKSDFGGELTNGHFVISVEQKD